MAGSRFTLPTPIANLRLDTALSTARSLLTWKRLHAALHLREGWATVFLAALMVLVVQFAITRAAWAAELSILPSVTYLGLLAGFILAKLPIRNWVGQLAGFVVGLAVIWLRTLAVIDGRFGGFRGKSIELAHRLGHYARATFVDGSAEDDLFLFVLVMAFLTFALAFLTMWWVLRSHWISPAIGLCGLTLLVNLGYDREDSKAFLALFLIVAIPLTIRFNAARNEWQWEFAHIAYPTSLSWRFMSVATGLTLGLLFVSYLVPFSVHTGPVNAAWERISAPWVGFENRFEQYFPSVAGRGRTRNTFPGFAAFGESFQLGGGLNLPDDPAIALKCDGGIFAQYVKMNTYDFYTGHGFKKRPVDVTAQQADGNLYDPRVDQAAGKPLPLPAAADQTARVNACTAELYRPRGNLLPVLGTQLEQTDTDARLSLGWQVYAPAGVHVPPLPGEVVPPQLADLIKQVSTLNGLTLPTDIPPTLRPGAPPQVTLQRDGTLVIYVPKGTAPMLSPDQYAAVVTRAQTANANATAPAGGAGAGGANSAKPPAISRVVVVEAPVIAPTVTVPPSPASIASAVRSTPTAVPTTTPAPVTVTPLDKRFDAITQEQTRLTSSLIQTQVVIEEGKVAAILYRGQAPNYGDIEQVVSKAPVPVGKQVTENARVSEATTADLRAAAPMPPSVPKWSTRYLQLPDTITQRTADLAEQLGKNVPTAYDYADAVEQYLRTNMTYSEKVPLPPFDRDATDYFLFQSKQGYCEYFSTAMVTLMRLGGVPAREVVGYLPGAKSEDGRFVSRENQAHAWVEVWFPKYGWVPYDPTPRPGITALVRGIQPVEQAPDPQANPEGNLQGGQDRLDSQDEDRLRQLDDELNGGGSGVYAPYKAKTEINPLFWIIPALLGTFALILSFFWLRAFRGLRPAAQWYGRMTRASRFAGLTRSSRATTPYELAAAVGQRLPGSGDAATLIAEQYAAERYASNTPDATEITEGRNAWLRLRQLILRSLLPRNRRVIKVAPQTPAIRPRGRRGR